jgi:hypothetical protein
MKPYIDLNTLLRQNAHNDFEKDFYKLMNNSVYGKTMENIHKRVNVKLVSHWDDIGKIRGARSLIARPNFKSVSVFNESLVAIQLKHLEFFYDKPIYVGFTVLDLSKLLMYDFFYEFLKPRYGDRVKLCYMDTDSFTLLIKTNDIYSDIKENLSKFDTSNFSPNNPFSVPLQNKAVIGLMKDENGGKIMTEFVGLRSKMYANKILEGRITKRVKGIKKNVVTNKINFENYLNCLFDSEILFTNQTNFRSIKHNIFTIVQRKLALSSLDDKRYIKDDKINTIAWGHYSLL